MRKDQALFLAAGLALGLIIGLVFGLVIGKPQLLGGTPHAATEPGGPPAAAENRVEQLRLRLNQNPQDAGALMELGDLLAQQGFTEQALAHFDRALQAAPSDPVLHLAAAERFLNIGIGQRAHQVAQRGLALDRTDPRIAEVAFRAAVHGAGDLEAAARALDELKRRNPGLPNHSQYQEELDQYRKLLVDGANRLGDPEIQARLGNFYFDTGQWDKAEAAYRRSLAARGGDPNVETDLGITIFRQGRHAEALKLFDNVLRYAPTQVQAAFNGVIVNLDNKDDAGARTWLGRLRQIQPNHPAIPQFEQRLGAAGP